MSVVLGKGDSVRLYKNGVPLDSVDLDLCWNYVRPFLPAPDRTYGTFFCVLFDKDFRDVCCNSFNRSRRYCDCDGPDRVEEMIINVNLKRVTPDVKYLAFGAGTIHPGDYYYRDTYITNFNLRLCEGRTTTGRSDQAELPIGKRNISTIAEDPQGDRRVLGLYNQANIPYWRSIIMAVMLRDGMGGWKADIIGEATGNDITYPCNAIEEAQDAIITHFR